MRNNKASATIACLVLALLLGSAAPLTEAARAQEPEPQGGVSAGAVASTAFTFQGRLMRNGEAVNGVTCTFTFALHAAASGGGSLASVSPAALVSDGYFTVEVDYGVAAFKGEARWLEVSVQCPGDGSPVSLDDKRIALNPAPYALGLRPGASVDASNTNALNVTTAATSGAALSASASATSGSAAGVYGSSSSSGGAGLSGANSSTGYGVYGRSDNGSGLYGISDSSYGIKGVGGTGYGVYGTGGAVSAWAGNPGSAVWGDSSADYGVHGTSDSAAGVMGQSGTGAGVLGRSTSGHAVYADGNAHVEGDLTWKAVTSYVAVPVSAFIPVLWNDTGHVEYDNNGDFLKNQSADYEWYTAPVFLPHGAVITGLRVGYKDGSDHEAWTYLRRRSMTTPATGAKQTLASVNSVGTSTGTIEGTRTDNTVDYATIDNASYTYFLEVNLPPGVEVFHIYGVVVEYQIARPY